MIQRILLLLTLFFLPFTMTAQTYNMSTTSVIACGGTFFDQGGAAGNYSNSQNQTMTFCSGVAGNCVRLNFTSMFLEDGFDYLYVYDGPTTASPLITTITGSTIPGVITATSGCLTVRFTSDASFNYAGWQAIVSCVNCATGGCTNTCSGGPAPANDACSGAENLGAIPAPAVCPSGIGAVRVVSGSTLCATAESPYTSLLGCQPSGNMASPAADVWYTFTITSPILNVGVSGMMNPNVGLYQGVACGAGLTPLNCAIGSNGILNTSFTGLAAGTYYLQVSGGSVTDRCDFTLSLQNNNDCSLCVIQSSLTANPPPLNGTYSPGQSVTFCYTISQYNQAVANWLHGVIPTFGAGWDMTTLTTNPPPSCSNAGTWSWYPNQITSSQTGLVSGPGFFFESNFGNPALVFDLNPGNNWGDNNGGNGCTWTFCWTIKTKISANCVPGANLNVNVDTYSDGESGSWTANACASDPVFSLPATSSCCPPPTIVVTNPTCSGINNGSAVAQGLGTSPWTYIWKNSGGATIQTAVGINGVNTINGLSAGTYSVTVTNGAGCTATTSFTVVAPAALTSTLSVTNVSCNGGTNGTATVVAGGGTPAYTYAWSPSGTGTSPTGLSAGTYTVTVTDSKGCSITKTSPITQPAIVTAVINSITPVSCNGGTNGSATVLAGGGTPGYTYLWSGGSTNTAATGLTVGAYTVTVTDSRGCTGNTTAIITQPTIINPVLSATPASCGISNGTASVSASGGTGAYTYSWSPSGGTGSNATGLPSGGYTVVVTDANSCSVIGNISVPNSSGPTAIISAFTDVTCNGGNNGSATGSANGGTLPYSYLWSTGANTALVNNLSAGTYTITVTDANACSSVASVIISQPVLLSATITNNIPVTCNGGNDGSLTVTAGGGNPPVAYLWSNGSSTTSATGLSAGTYTVTVTDSRGCTISTSGIVTQPTVLAAVLSSSTPVTCNGGSDGTATPVGAGGTPPYTYAWSNGASGQILNGLTAGPYTVTVTDANNCTASLVVNIVEPAILTATISSHTDVLCNGANTGKATVLAGGGTSPYNYSWSPSGGTGVTATGLTAGNYTVLITDANNCTQTASITIREPAILTVDVSNPTDVSCNGGNDGAITATPNGGASPYTYLWSTGGTNAIAGNLSAATYTVTVTDNNGCSISASTVIKQPLLLTASITSNTPVTCNGDADGSASVTAADGTAPYTYLWSDGSTGTSISGLTAGSYTVTVTDANNCTAQTTAIIVQPAIVTAIISNTVNATCNGSTNGSATVTAGGGTPAYSYLWSDGSTGTSLNNLTAGSYTVTVTDSRGCSQNTTAIIVEPAIISLSLSATPASCGNTNGSATVVASGGTGTLTYLWSPAGGIAATANGLAANTYTVTVTDANNCTVTDNIAVPLLSGPTAVITSLTNVNCNGGNNGTTSCTAVGGTAPYTFLWSTGDVTTALNNLAAGTYTVTATDANACTAVASVIITQPVILTATISSNIPVTCNGGNNGSLTISAGGGTSPITYLWSDGSTGTSITNLSAGTYSVTVTDNKNCTVNISEIITEPLILNAIIISSTPASCNGGSNGTATVNGNGGTAPYSFLWSNGANGATVSGLAAGNYTVTITDVNNCTTQTQVNITEPALLTATISASSDVICNGGNTGSATVSAGGGTSPYSYNWTPSGGTSNIATNLTAGNYDVTVTDANGCTITASVVIAEPPLLVVALINQNNVACNGGTTGFALIDAHGGVPAYTYSWAPLGGNATTLTGVAAGNYTMTVQDLNGCSQSLLVVITEPQLLSIAITSSIQVSCNAGSDGSLTSVANGGVLPYSYSWSSGANTAIAGSLTVGTYTVTVTDANGCTAQITDVITEPTPLALVMSATSANCGVSNGTATVATSGGTPNYTYQWSPSGGNSATAVALPSGGYAVTVTDANGCTSLENINVPNATGPSASLSSTVDVSCNGGADGSAQIAVTGGANPISYQWSPNVSSTNAAANLVAGNYTVTVTDGNSCTSVVAVIINEPSQVVVVVNLISDALCTGAANGALVAVGSGGTPGYVYSWSSGSVIDTASSLSIGNYTVTVTDANGCTAVNQGVVAEPNLLVASITSNIPASCNGSSDGSLTAAANGGVLPYSYSWSSGVNAAIAGSLSVGTYTVTVTDANGCTAQISDVITEPVPLALVMSATSANCGVSNGTATVATSGGTPNYTYQWSPSGGNSLTAVALPSGGYTVTVTDANGCTTTDNINVPNATGPSASLSSTVDVSCNGGADGSAMIAVSGGANPISYQWSPNVSTTNTATNLVAGNYTVTVTDGNSCTSVVAIIINEPALLTLSNGTITDVLCYGGNNGSAAVIVNGGTANYSYLWSNGNTGSAANGLVAGSYTITVTDSKGCTAQTSLSVNEPQALTASLLSSTDVSCFGGNDGALNVSITGGIAPYSYVWSNGSLTANIATLIANNYTLTVTDSNNCTATLTASISEPSPLVLNITSQTNVACAGGNTGSLDVTASGGTASYSYAWSPSGGSSALASNLLSGIYTVVVTDTKGCTASISSNVTQPTPVTLSLLSYTDVTCNGLTNGSIQVLANGGVPAYSYQWNPSTTGSSSAFNLAAGNYSITVTDQNGCSASLAQIITEPLILQGNITIVDANCAGSTTGSASAAVNGGTSPYAYVWSLGGAITNSINNLSAGNYTVTVSDINGCTIQLSKIVTEPSAIQLSMSGMPASCGQTNGSASVIAIGGAGNYSYNWTPGSVITSTVNNIAAGPYQVVVTDQNGCSSTGNVNVNNLGGPSITPGAITDVKCFGGSDGSASVNVISGNGPYTYNWIPSGGTNASVTNLIAGIYNVNVTDINGCSSSLQININEPAVLSVIANAVTAHCGNPDGTATAIPSGGSSPYSFVWSGNSSVTANANGLLAGTYSVTVTDNNFCTSSTSVIVADASSPVASISNIIQANCNGSANGSATVNSIGGTGPYSYLWSNGNITSLINGLVAGNYTATVTDVFGCTSSATVIISEPAPLVLNLTNVSASCGLSNGSAQVNVTGGIIPYNYNWAPGGSINASISNLAAGTFTVTVTDGNGCTASENTIVANAGGPTLASGGVTNVNCNGEATGEATLTIVSGNGPYVINWTPSGGNNVIATGLLSGNYTSTVTDINGCSAVLNFVITEPGPLVVNNITTDVSCFGGVNGTATIDATGGTAPYTFNWNPGGVLSAYRSALPAGNYNVTVTDNVGCSASTLARVFQPTELAGNVTIVDANCFGSSTGSLTMNANGGIGPYNYSWSNGVTGTASISNLLANTYTVTVADNHGCTFISSTVLDQPAEIILQETTTPASCGTANGSASVNANGGSGVLNYQWSGGLGTTSSISNIIAGNYTITVSDQQGCSVQKVISVPNLGGPVVNLTGSTNVNCAGGNTGSATVNVSSGNGPFQYTWLPSGGNTAQANGLTAGNYTVAIQDINGCISNVPVIITEPLPLDIQFSTTDAACGNATGSATASVNGGVVAYSYLWSTGLTGSTSASSLLAGTYTFTVTDANGCSLAKNVIVPATGGPVVNVASVIDASCFGSNDGSASVNATGGSGAYTYNWLPTGGTQAAASNLAAGNYTVTVTDANGCGIPINIAINEPTQIQLTAVIQSATCNNANGSATISVNGGSPSYSYIWSTGSVIDKIQNIVAGNYSVTITDNKGCIADTSVLVPNTNGPALGITTFNNVNCNGGNTGSIQVNVTGGSGVLTYLWSNGNTTSSANNLTAGNYTITVTDGNGCLSSITKLITEPGALQALISTSPASCNQTNGSINVTATGGVSNYTYLWNNGAITASQNGIIAGAYTVTVSDNNGCTIVTQGNIDNTGGPSLSVTSTTPTLCNGGSDGKASVLAQNGTGPYNYSWFPSGGTNSSAVGLTAGSYTVSVTDANGCIANTPVIITEPLPIQLQTISTPTNCNTSNGSVNVIPQGGTIPYMYAWNTGALTSNVNGLASGNYTITVTDLSGCTSQAIVNVPSLGGPAITITNITSVKCFGGTDGGASISVNNGTAPYQYLWSSSGGNSATATNLSAGNYSVTVTDAGGCQQVQNLVIPQPLVLTASTGSITMVSCHGGNNGQALINVSGGTMPYNYNWSNGGSGIAATSLIAGNYSVTITDANGCTAKNNIVITEPIALSIANQSSKDVSCYGGSNGLATVNVTGGISPYSFSWSNGIVGNDSIINIQAGNYSATITDGNSCTIISSFVIHQPTALVVTPPIINEVLCFGGNNGSAKLSPSGGVSPYIINWSTGAIGDSAIQLIAGNYSVTVTDKNNCTSTQAFQITEPSQLQLQSVLTPVLCNGSSTGTLNVVLIGGTPSYTVNWNSPLANGFTNRNLPAGNYTARFTDSHSCYIDTTWKITEPAPLVVNLNAPTVICIGQSSTISATVTGGTSAYTYQWNNSFTGSSQSVSPATTTVYTVTITDQNGCITLPKSTTVPVNPPLTLNLITPNDSICRGGSVSLSSTVSGGNGGPYSYTWSNLSTNVAGQIVKPDSTSSYMLTVSDGCGTPVAYSTTRIVVNESPIVAFNPFTADGCSPVSVAFYSTSQTTANSAYYWVFGDQTTGTGKTEQHTYSSAGTYSVSLTVTNAYGCSSTLKQNNIITVHPVPLAFFTPNPQQSTILNPQISFVNQSIVANAFAWNFGDGSSENFEFMPSHNYQDTGHYTVRLIARTNFGCIDTFYSEVVIQKDFSVYIPNAFSPNDDGRNEAFTAYGVGIASGEMLIFDRWGKQVYKGSLEEPWRGQRNDNGDPCPIDVYVYLFNIIAIDGSPYQYTGRVSLIR